MTEISAPAGNARHAGAGTAFIRAVGVSKTYGAIKALVPTDFVWAAGEVVGLIGHNGAGKSTLINLLAGTAERTAGDFQVTGAVAERWTPAQAQRAGLRCVFQELSLCPNLTTIENTRVLHRSLRGPGWKSRAEAAILKALDQVFPDHGIPLSVPVAELPIGQRQMIEIARAFSETETAVRGIILDEPTSSLGPEATQHLLAQIRRVAARGISCILITHRLNEILAVADRVVVMKDGAIIADRANRDLTRTELVRAMGNIETERRRRPSTAQKGPPLLRHATGETAVQGDQTIELHPGEILGLAGLDGHGQRERLREMYEAADRQGTPVAFVAGDRVVEGVFALWSIRDNLIVRSLGALSRAGVIARRAADKLAEDWFQRLGVRAPGIATPLLSLSGGNQQKVLFARALASDARVIVLDDPMRGVDVGTKQEVYGLIKAEAAAGRAFIWYSTELEELENCDRVHVFREGRAVVALEGSAIEHNRILQASFGGDNA